MRADWDRIIELMPDHVNRIQVSEWAEQNRILPEEGGATPGPFRWNVTPYLREIADCLSGNSDIQEVAVQKGAQVGFTTGVLENWIGYIIDVTPGPALMVDADKGMAEAGMELRIDKMIESAGLSDKITPQTRKRHGKGTGDTKSLKQFPGGFFRAIGPKSGSKLRKDPIRFLSFDEIDAYPQTVGTDEGKTANEGDTISLAYRRTATFGAARKVLYGSTPLVEATSRIAKLFRIGDQRYYQVPCIHCGHWQTIRWRDPGPDGEFRLKFETDDAGNLKPESVHYECEKCGGPWKQGDKWVLLSLGKWVPTATPRRPRMRSYHISSLYSIKQSWEEICQMWIEAQGDMAALRTFVNTVLGEPWIERGEAPIAEKVWARREGYAVGTLPESAKPLFCTIGADVQKDRIEAEVVAWGRDKESWSIEYLTLGLGSDTADPDAEAWRELAKVIEATHAGLQVYRTMIDSGYQTPEVYSFCEKHEDWVHPIKGDPQLERERGLTRVCVPRHVPGYRVKRIDLNVTHLKLEVYNHLKRGTADGKPPDKPAPGYCHFPFEYSRDHFSHLMAEDRLPKLMRNGRTIMKWEQHGRNEPLDCRAYALSGVYLIYGMRWDEMQQGAQEGEEVPYSWSDFWNEVEAIASQK
jgi:phage terminase large subunit GpA-like protein